MKGKETLTALIEGKVLRSPQGWLYKLDADTGRILCTDSPEHIWGRPIVPLAGFCEREMVEHRESDYDLSFFEAVNMIFGTEDIMTPCAYTTRAYWFEGNALMMEVRESMEPKREIRELDEEILSCGWKVHRINEPEHEDEQTEAEPPEVSAKPPTDTERFRCMILGILREKGTWLSAIEVSLELFDTGLGKDWLRKKGYGEEDEPSFVGLARPERNRCLSKISNILMDLVKKGLIIRKKDKGSGAVDYCIKDAN